LFFVAVVLLAAVEPAYASGRVWSEVSDNVAYVHHDSAYFNCCPEMVFEIERHSDTNLIDIFEEDTLPQCDCMCDFDFVHKIAGLEPGTYLARVWENNHSDTHGFRLAGKTIFVIPAKVEPYSTRSLRSECGGWSGTEENPLSTEGLELSSNALTRPTIEIFYNLPQDALVILAIYDVIGTKVRTLELGYQGQGKHALTWDARDDSGDPLPGGIYFVRLKAAGESRSLSLIVLR
jgi:hypothetical protein